MIFILMRRGSRKQKLSPISGGKRLKNLKGKGNTDHNSWQSAEMMTVREFLHFSHTAGDTANLSTGQGSTAE
jgi:hypothetical protein